MRRWGVGFLLLLAFGQVHGQYTSRLGRFSVDEIKGCAPFTVTITILEPIPADNIPYCTPGKPCNMIFETNGPQQQNTFTYTYTQPGQHTLTVIFPTIGIDDILITIDPNIAPAFDIYTCGNNEVRIRITDRNYDSYFIDFDNDGNVDQIIPSGNDQTVSHSYPIAGNYTISVRGRDINSALNCTPRSQAFVAVAQVPLGSITEVAAQDNGGMAIALAPASNVLHRLDIATNNETTFQLLQNNLFGITQTSASGLNHNQSFYCFRLGSVDPCFNTVTYAPVVCAPRLLVNAQNGNNQLTWSIPANGITTSRISRNAAPYTVIPGSPGSFSDPNIECKVTYCYQLTSEYANGSRGISRVLCTEAFLQATLPAIPNITATLNPEGNEATLDWVNQPAATVYSVFRREGTQVFRLLGTTPAAPGVDGDFSVNRDWQYRVDYRDACDNASAPGLIATPVRLSAAADNKNDVEVRWSRYRGWAAGVATYEVNKYDATGNLLTQVVTTDTLWLDADDRTHQVVQYRVRARATETGVGPAWSNRVVLRKEPNLFSPTAFTPNNDQLNDVFTVFGNFVQQLTLQIFDRWGNLVFSTNQNEPWDGTHRGKLLPEAAYVWKATIVDFTGQTSTRTGTVALLHRGGR